jgi:hypothetical protein
MEEAVVLQIVIGEIVVQQTIISLGIGSTDTHWEPALGPVR